MEKLDKNLLAIIKQLNEALTTKKETVPEDEKYYKKYEGAGMRVANAWSGEPLLCECMKELIYDMYPEEKKWSEYCGKYFKGIKFKTEFMSDEFIENFKKSYFVTKFLYGINHNKTYKRCDKYGHIDIDELCKLNNSNMYEWWGRMMTDSDEPLETGKTYTFKMSIPVSENIPTYDEYNELS